ncbi:MAG TPA: ribonuclease Z [Bacteroidales bacterium]
MVDFKVLILGNGSAVPTRWHNPTSQIVFYGRSKFLIDCAEGAQMQMIRYKVSGSTIDHIFISHLHGDHFFGLIGLISSSHLAGRQKDLFIYAPDGLEGLINHHLELTNTTLRFPLHFVPHEKNKKGPLYEDKNLTVNLIPLKHSVPSWGFVFKEKKRNRRISKEFVEDKKPSVELIQKIKQGEDFVGKDGEVIRNKEITLPPFPPRSYAYCSDTAYDESIIPFIKNVNLLYHESTFDSSMHELAESVLHSTSEQAATIAKKANAGKLLLGHYSGRFKQLYTLEDEARKVFPNSVLSREGERYDIG